MDKKVLEVSQIGDKTKLFRDTELKFRVRTIQNDDGSISINAEDTAIGFGWYQIKSAKKYPKWERINSFITDLGFSPQVEKDDFIPESLFYMLAMKANNKAAYDFQKWLAVDVIPSIRKTGLYQMPKMSKELQAIFAIDERTVELDSRITKLENNTTIDYSQQEELRTLGTKKVVAILGGTDAPAYKELNKKVFSSFWRDYKRKLEVNSYKNTLVKDFETGKQAIINWCPSKEVSFMIRGCNAQMRM
ncbi:ORF6C domain-containing protein [Clostridium botulinum]|uniref:Uncharacterized protein n=1 Tax=Clostridium botulinum TaxID=1491 RepID=A0A6B4JIA6_CLOBO|nr:ORF6C domain-containing protein [Clostridium botulinum]EES50477.1 BRO domain protein [Clostridium botulinum E1 str. 'BoNT E Beluga']MBY6760036.1 ORF6C domain-containing protein [Clostridium botulinum]MBY6918945.1 ORF6C domain-containing protein [Clostridium botulinum]MCR1132592.1 ORF6C domain-containing protein [Clostridium botulinum]NFH70458.1 hypothetical protein [Clostridium botulinum]